MSTTIHYKKVLRELGPTVRREKFACFSFPFFRRSDTLTQYTYTVRERAVPYVETHSQKHTWGLGLAALTTARAAPEGPVFITPSPLQACNSVLIAQQLTGDCDPQWNQKKAPPPPPPPPLLKPPPMSTDADITSLLNKPTAPENGTHHTAAVKFLPMDCVY